MWTSLLGGRNSFCAATYWACHFPAPTQPAKRPAAAGSLARRRPANCIIFLLCLHANSLCTHGGRSNAARWAHSAQLDLASVLPSLIRKSKQSPVNSRSPGQPLGIELSQGFL